MIPLLFQGTFFETPTYFLLYMLSFLGAIIFAVNRAKKFDLSPVRTVDLGMVLFVSGFIGARLFHIVLEAPDYYLRDPIRVFYFWQGGFVLYGGLISGVGFGYLFLRYFNEPIRRWMDLTAPAVVLGIGIGRMGCLSTGCCYGQPTDSWWGMIFTNPQAAAPLNIALHPTQLLESLFCFALAAILHFVFRRPHKIEGLGLLVVGIIYSLFRFSIEFLRGDLERGFVAGGRLSTSQFISIFVFLVSVGFIFAFVKRRRAF